MTKPQDRIDIMHEIADTCPTFGPLMAEHGRTRAVMPVDANKRKSIPIATGVLDYFPDAIAAVAEVSKAGNEQHHPGKPLHWDRSKSTDEADACMRHFMQRGGRDADGIRHSAKMAWRALALLQKEIEAESKSFGLVGGRSATTFSNG